MRVLVAGIVLLLAASTAAQAFPFKRKSDRMPKPIDSPIVRPKIREDHKVGKRAGRHPAQFQQPTWGNEWKTILSIKPHHPFPDYLTRTE